MQKLIYENRYSFSSINLYGFFSLPFQILFKSNFGCINIFNFINLELNYWNKIIFWSFNFWCDYWKTTKVGNKNQRRGQRLLWREAESGQSSPIFSTFLAFRIKLPYYSFKKISLLIFRSHREASFLFFGRLLRQFSAESLRKKRPKLSNLQKSAKPLKILSLRV